jgi:hypothetical protein
MSTLPLRVREIIRGDGSRARTLLVFCPRERASIAPETCARCAFRCPPEDGKYAPAVGCGAAEPGASAPSPAPAILCGPDPVASHLSTGTASAQIVLCVLADAPFGVVHRAVLSTRRWLAFPVVDEQGKLLGTLPSALVTGVGEEPREAFLPVADAMLPALSVRESEPLDSALSTMTSHHLRHVPIVDAAQRVTGVLSDLEVLRWIARGTPRRWW